MPQVCIRLLYVPGARWVEWNGKFKDDVRRFLRGDGGLVGALAHRLTGSPDIYQAAGHLPVNCINFISSHDTLTLNDTVLYNEKNNWENGEGNYDGVNENLSWNCGGEGPTSDAAVEMLRSRQVRNAFAILMLSRGVPMFFAGDEVRRTQHGNNNPLCQDNEISWLDWTLQEQHPQILRFVQRMVAFRKRHSMLSSQRFFTGERNERGIQDVSWHGTMLGQPGWSDPNARALAVTLGGFDGDADLHVMLNMWREPLMFELPVSDAIRWHVAVDTFQPGERDISDPGNERPWNLDTYRVEPHSVVVLVSK